MEITKTQENGRLTLAIVGKIDSVTAPQLNAELKAMPTEIVDLSLDFNDVEYVSSAGLRSILTAQKEMNARKGKMVLKGVNANVKHVLDLTGFSPVLTFA